MITIYEGGKATVGFIIARNRGSGTISLINPERRILNASRALIEGFDWAAAAWDSNTNYLTALFDSTQTNLTGAGIYFMQLRGTVGAELYEGEIKIMVKDWGG